MPHEELDPINRYASPDGSSPFSSTLELMISALHMDVTKRFQGVPLRAICRDAAALVPEGAEKLAGADQRPPPVMSIKCVPWHIRRRASAVHVSQLCSMRPQVPAVTA